jgi:23S rRNA pseudouridine2605 synthase
MATERLQKILARGGIASRRAAERAITDGRVRVNGRVVTELGSKADPMKDRVEIDGVRVVAESLVYVILHKPRGVVTTMSDPEGRPSIREILGSIGARVYPVGRLDFATSGILLVTNDGEFADGLMHPRKAVPKTYVVKVAGVMQPKDLDQWREGIRLEDGVTLPAKVSFLRHEGDKTWMELTIREGRNQQIRRMGEASGFPVMRLARLSFAGVSAEGLKPGAWRYMTPDELLTLRKEFGVPKKIVDGEARAKVRGRSDQGEFPDRALGPGRGRRPARSRPEAGAATGFERPRAKEPSGVERPRSSESGGRDRGQSSPSDRSRANESRAGGRGRSGRSDRSRTNESTGRGRGAPSRSSGSDRSRTSESPSATPRYGGGSPGRRSYNVTEDWGGGAGRGRSGGGAQGQASGSGTYEPGSGGGRRGASRSDRNEAMPRGDVGGRNGGSRTTGTGGGIGAGGGGEYRVKGRGKGGR